MPKQVEVELLTDGGSVLFTKVPATFNLESNEIWIWTLSDRAEVFDTMAAADASAPPDAEVIGVVEITVPSLGMVRELML